MKAVDGVGGQGILFLACTVLDVGEAIALGVEDVDTTPIGTHPDHPLSLLQAEHDVVAQVSVARMVVADQLAGGTEATYPFVIGGNPETLLSVEQHIRNLQSAIVWCLFHLSVQQVDAEDSIPTATYEHGMVWQKTKLDDA